jgi:hypothetical protein
VTSCGRIGEPGGRIIRPLALEIHVARAEQCAFCHGLTSVPNATSPLNAPSAVWFSAGV